MPYLGHRRNLPHNGIWLCSEEAGACRWLPFGCGNRKLRYVMNKAKDCRRRKAGLIGRIAELYSRSWIVKINVFVKHADNIMASSVEKSM